MEVIFQNQMIKWINLNNPTAKQLEEVALNYNFLKPTIEDSLEPGHLPKFEYDENISFLLIRFFNKRKQSVNNIVRDYSHKMGIYFGKDFLITVHQEGSNIIELVKQKYLGKNDSNKITKKGLIYHLVSETLLTFEAPALKMDDEINRLENLIFNNNSVKLQNFYRLKREASTCKKILDYTLEALREYSFVNNKTTLLQSLREDCIKMQHMHSQVIEDLQNLLSMYISLNSQKSNDIMKTLTIFSAFFLPLTFIVGVYGMNFKYMPELDYKWAYPMSLLIMLGIVVVIFIWFKRKKYF